MERAPGNHRARRLVSLALGVLAFAHRALMVASVTNLAVDAMASPPPVEVHYVVTADVAGANASPAWRAQYDRLRMEGGREAGILYAQHVGFPRYWPVAPGNWQAEYGGVPPAEGTDAFVAFGSRVAEAARLRTAHLPAGSLAIIDLEDYRAPMPVSPRLPKGAWRLFDDDRLEPYRGPMVMHALEALQKKGVSEKRITPERLMADAEKEWNKRVKRLFAEALLQARIGAPSMRWGFYGMPSDDGECGITDAAMIGGWSGVPMFPYAYLEWPAVAVKGSGSGKVEPLSDYLAKVDRSVSGCLKSVGGVYLMVHQARTRENTPLAPAEARAMIGAALTAGGRYMVPPTVTPAPTGVVIWGNVTAPPYGPGNPDPDAQAAAFGVFLDSLLPAIREANATNLRVESVRARSANPAGKGAGDE